MLVLLKSKDKIKMQRNLAKLNSLKICTIFEDYCDLMNINEYLIIKYLPRMILKSMKIKH